MLYMNQGLDTNEKPVGSNLPHIHVYYVGNSTGVEFIVCRANLDSMSEYLAVATHINYFFLWVFFSYSGTNWNIPHTNSTAIVEFSVEFLWQKFNNFQYLSHVHLLNFLRMVL